MSSNADSESSGEMMDMLESLPIDWRILLLLLVVLVLGFVAYKKDMLPVFGSSSDKLKAIP